VTADAQRPELREYRLRLGWTQQEMADRVAGHLAYEDLGDALSGRAYYGIAVDSAREVEDDQTAAIALGYTAQLAYAEGMTSAAVEHLAAALAHAKRAPALAPWLASIQATFAADSGDYTAAADALHRAEPRRMSRPSSRPCCLATDPLT
jgi:hypothetical protein